MSKIRVASLMVNVETEAFIILGNSLPLQPFLPPIADAKEGYHPNCRKFAGANRSSGFQYSNMVFYVLNNWLPVCLCINLNF